MSGTSPLLTALLQEHNWLSQFESVSWDSGIFLYETRSSVWHMV